jgi:hypothetical protein
MVFVVTALFALCECDYETSTDILYVEGNKVVLKVLVAESVAQCVYSLKFGIVDLDSAALEVGDIEKCTELGLNQSTTLIDGLAGAIDLDYRFRRFDRRIPPRNRAILGYEEENRLLAGRDFETARVVKDGAGWS